MFRKNIILLTSDSPVGIATGLGESIYRMVINLKEYKFYSFGVGDEGKMTNLEHYNISQTFNGYDYYKNNVMNDLIKVISILGNRTDTINVVHVLDSIYIPLGIKLKKFLNCKLYHTFALSSSKQSGIMYEYYNKPQDFVLDNYNTLLLVQDLENRILMEADEIIFVSEYYKKLFNKNYKDKYNVVLNGVDFKLYSSIIPKEKYNLPGTPGVLKILYIGRLAGMKNIINLMNTPIPSGVEILVASGKHGSMPWVYDTMKNNTPKNFVFIDFISGEYKYYILQNVDAVIVPSIHEPFGLVTLEAIASRTLLLCSRTSGMAEYIDDDMCINCGTEVSELENAMIRLKTMSDVEKTSIINNAYEKTRHLTWENNALEHKKIYEKYD